MATPSMFKVTGLGGMVENAKVNVDKLYLRQVFEGSGANQSDVIEPNATTGLGKTVVNNWGIYDGPGSTAKLVANTHGMQTLASKWSNWFTLVFVVERFKGSTLQVMGANDEDEENEWAIVGGTGEFAMARGIITRRIYGSYVHPKLTQELSIEFFCRMKEVIVAPPTQIPAPTKIPELTKRGPWGGTAGSLKEMEGKSRHLESITIYHHAQVEGFEFSYVDEDGKTRTTGTWGLNRNLLKNEIKFDPSEFVKEITGVGRSGTPSWLSQFKIITNHRSYGPFGFDIGTPCFSQTVPENETVVGFFGEVDTYITRIGFYTIPQVIVPTPTRIPAPPMILAPPMIPAPLMIPKPKKRGPWGGNGGTLKDMEGKSQRLESLTIYHHGVVEGFQFSYIDEDGQIRTIGIWGQYRNLWKIEIKFGPSEYVKEISGVGSFDGSYLSQLKIVTNNSTYGPFGTYPGTPFSTTVPENETVVGFFGSHDNPGNNWIKTIGVYTIPTYPEMPAPPKIPASVTKRGPWGGNGGSLTDMEGKSQRLESLTIYHHGVVEGFQFSYIDTDGGEIRTTGIWGKNYNRWKAEIKFGPSEYVKQIIGAGHRGNPSWLCQFKIVTNNTTYGPYGTWDGIPFSSTVPENEKVVGFFGSSDDTHHYITTIGVYTISK